MLSRKNYKNQITLPKGVMAKFGDTEYFDVREECGSIVLRPVEANPRTSTAEIRKKIASLGLKEKDIEDAVSRARQKS